MDVESDLVESTLKSCSGIQTSSLGISSRVQQAIAVTISTIKSVFFGTTESKFIEEDWLQKLVIEAFESTSDEYQQIHAAEWASDFTWPHEVLSRDLARLQACEGDLDRLVNTIHQSKAKGRLSLERIKDTLDKDNPEIDHLIDLVKGIEVLKFITEPNFIPNEFPPPLRGVHKMVGKAIDKLSFEGWSKDRVLILPTKELLQIPGVHFSPAHWTTKKGKKCGRLIWDGSDDSKGNCLNSIYVRDSIKEHYGFILNPDLDDIMQLILLEESKWPVSTWVTLELTKGDVASAFPQLNFKGEDSKLMACQLENNLSMVFHTGHFGWSGTPFAFNVVTKALRHEFKIHIQGESQIYVDDYFWISQSSVTTSNINVSSSIVEGLLGPGSVAVDKLETGRKIDIIGWHFDLDLRIVSLTQRAMHKLIHSMFSIEVTQKFSLKHIQRLASWTSLYSKVLRHLRPFSAALYTETVGLTNQNMSKNLGVAAQSSIMIWRVMLCMVSFNPSKFARAFDTFREVKPTILIEYDSSLTGTGLAISELLYNSNSDSQSSSKKLVGVGCLEFPFDLQGDSSFQNSCEFMAVLISLLIIGQLGYYDVTIKLIGDSVTSNK
jgi:hypothetical protein